MLAASQRSIHVAVPQPTLGSLPSMPSTHEPKTPPTLRTTTKPWKQSINSARSNSSYYGGYSNDYSYSNSYNTSLTNHQKKKKTSAVVKLSFTQRPTVFDHPEPLPARPCAQRRPRHPVRRQSCLAALPVELMVGLRKPSGWLNGGFYSHYWFNGGFYNV